MVKFSKAQREAIFKVLRERERELLNDHSDERGTYRKQGRLAELAVMECQLARLFGADEGGFYPEEQQQVTSGGPTRGPTR